MIKLGLADKAVVRVAGAMSKTSGMIRLEKGDFGFTYLIVDEDSGRDILVQSDYYYPSIARDFGWSHEHGETDGTIDCPVCGKSVHEMINEAQEYLDEHIGDTTEDPGYFDSDEEEPV